jgi:hypothetical protein
VTFNPAALSAHWTGGEMYGEVPKDTPTEDRTLTCTACGQPFTWKAHEQAWYAERHFVAPKRCKRCREGARVRRERSDDATLF